GVIEALKDARITPLPPVTGQDAELSALRRIVRGEQYMTVYKPFADEADAAAEAALALARGEGLEGMAEERIDTPAGEEVPAILLDPVGVTLDNLEETVIRDGFFSVEEICTREYRSACARAGLTD
ncbi:ABC transporter substrate-binding protein, partial [Streptomyces klenkii]